MAKSSMFSAATIKRFTSVHSWVGIFAGSILFIAFYAGSLTMYVAPLHLWANPQLRASNDGMRDLARLVETVGADPAAARNFSVTIDGRAPVASFYEEGGGRYVSHTRMVGTGGKVENRASASDVDRLIDELHFTAGIPDTPGYIMLAIVCAVYFLALITGVIIQLPHVLADIYAMRVGKNLKKMWMDAHNAIGVVSLPFHLMFAITGFLLSVVFMLPDLYVHVTPTDSAVRAYRDGSGHGDGGDDRGGRGGGEAPTPANARMLPPADLIALASSRLSGFTPQSISYASYGTVDATATVNGRVRGALASEGSVGMSAVSGKISEVDAAGIRPTPKSVERGYTALHYGDFGGEIMRALYFVLGMGGAFLFYSGNLLWVETKRKRRHVGQARSGWMVAQMTIGVCLGSCFGIALALLGSRVLAAGLIADDWERKLYYLGFFAAVLWSFGRPPIRAASEILVANALVYAALPIINASTSPDNLLKSFATGTWDIAWIDTVFILLALAFGYGARKTAARGRNGQPNSVWSDDARTEVREPARS